MDLKQKINADFVAALKARDTPRKTTLGMIKSKITEAEKKDGIELVDEGVLAVVLSYQKQLDDVIAQAPGTPLAESSRLEKEFIADYLPAKMTDDEIRKIIGAITEHCHSSGEKEARAVFSIVMKEFKNHYVGRYNTRELKDTAEEMLGLKK